ncbi:mucin-2 isoform X1 [Culicoides brevitarsis]|uniref:mucin-2 isoform X1 n=1 Tax=Culicoides brevitarsis TaxID=469753 RepID=UPI00307C9559
MSNLPPLPVLCDTPPPIDDFSNIPDDDYVDYDGIADDYDVDVMPSPKKFEVPTKNDDDTPLPYLGNRSPPDGTDQMTLEFAGDDMQKLDLDSPPSLNLSSDLKITSASCENDFTVKSQATDCVLESVDASQTTSPQDFAVMHDGSNIDRHIEGGENGEICQLPEKTQEDAAQKRDSQVFDDFTDFQSVPPDKDELQIDHWGESAAVTTNDDPTFDVDFSNFQDFSVPPTTIHIEDPPKMDDDDDFDNFQNFSTAECVPAAKTVITPPAEIDDDDDFGDFSDFQTNTAPVTMPQHPIETPPVVAESTLPSLTLETFTKTIDLMFPASSQSMEIDQNARFAAISFEKNSITSNLKDIEMSRALSYKYANSVTSRTLMESIGIDAKNVLFGMKWNPGMPRFAANLSFDPIQPQPLLQPTSASTNTKPCDAKASDAVPVAQFDWSTAGLVNPLDVSHTLLLDELEATVMAPTKFKNSNSPSSSYFAASPSSSSISSSSISSHHNYQQHHTKSINKNFYHSYNSHHRTFVGQHLETIARYWEDSSSQIPANASAAAKPLESPLVDEEKVSAVIPSTAPSSIMDEISTTGTTHYSDSNYSFKSSSEASSQQPTPLSPTYGMSVRTITLPETHIFTPEKCTNAISQSVDRESATQTVKEYHDVEYKLDKSITSDCISSISGIGSSIISDSVHLSHFSVSQPTLTPSAVTSPTLEPELIEDFSTKISLKPEKNSRNFPIFGTSPTDMGEKDTKNEEDDDFSDFQAAPVTHTVIPEPIKPKPVTSMLNPLPLSPVHLMKTANNITLPEPDDDEMLRIEAFARSKGQTTTSTTPATTNNNDDDEWSDFTSAQMPQKPPPPTTTTSNHDDDWSDFVFTTPASSGASMMSPIIANHHRATQKQNWNNQGNYMPWSTSTGGTAISHISQGQTLPEMNFIQSQKSAFVNGPNRMMRK